MRMMRALTPPTVPSRYDMNGNAASSKSMSLHSFFSSVRLFGPTTAVVAQWSVTVVR